MTAETRQLGQDSQDRTPGTGYLGWDTWDRSPREGHPGQDTQGRTPRTGYSGQDTRDRTPGKEPITGHSRQDKTSGAGHPGQDIRGRTPRTGHLGQENWTGKLDRKGKTDQFLLGILTWSNFYPPCFTGLIPTKIFICTGIFQPPLSKTPHKNLKNYKFL